MLEFRTVDLIGLPSYHVYLIVPKSLIGHSHLVRENTAAFAKMSKRKNYRIDLVGVGINARLPLRSGIALTVDLNGGPG